MQTYHINNAPYVHGVMHLGDSVLMYASYTSNYPDLTWTGYKAGYVGLAKPSTRAKWSVFENDVDGLTPVVRLGGENYRPPEPRSVVYPMIIPTAGQRMGGVRTAGVIRCSGSHNYARYVGVETHYTQPCPTDIRRGPAGGLRHVVRMDHEATRPKAMKLIAYYPTLTPDDEDAVAKRVGDDLYVVYEGRFAMPPTLTKVTVSDGNTSLLFTGLDARDMVNDFDVLPGGKLVAAAIVRYSDRYDHVTHVAPIVSTSLNLYDVLGYELRLRTSFDVPSLYAAFSPDGLTLAAYGPSPRVRDGRVHDEKSNTLTILDVE